MTDLIATLLGLTCCAVMGIWFSLLIATLINGHVENEEENDDL